MQASPSFPITSRLNRSEPTTPPPSQPVALLTVATDPRPVTPRPFGMDQALATPAASSAFGGQGAAGSASPIETAALAIEGLSADNTDPASYRFAVRTFLRRLECAQLIQVLRSVEDASPSWNEQMSHLEATIEHAGDARQTMTAIVQALKSRLPSNTQVHGSGFVLTVKHFPG